MPHLRFIWYALVALVGVTALALSTFGVIRSRVPAYWYLTAFYAGFTVMILMISIREYLYLNVAGYSILAVYRTYAVSSVVEPLFLVALALFLHRFTAVRYPRIRDGAVLAVGAAAAAAPSLPGAVTLDITAMSLTFGLLFRISNILYLAIFTYVLASTAASLRRDKSPRELVLIGTLLAFGLVGFLESIPNVLGGARASTLDLRPGAADLLVSTVPYAVFGAVLIYYFGAFLLADTKAAERLEAPFVSKFGISKREEEVIELLNRGLSNGEIAERLFVSLATVKTHVHNIYRKTGASSRYDLFHMIRGSL